MMDKIHIQISPTEDTEISVNIDGLVQYVMERANREYSDDFPISNIENWIREFFMTYAQRKEVCKQTEHDWRYIDYYKPLVCSRCGEENKST